MDLPLLREHLVTLCTWCSVLAVPARYNWNWKIRMRHDDVDEQRCVILVFYLFTGDCFPGYMKVNEQSPCGELNYMYGVLIIQ